jgi:hypothetical protein
VYDMTSLWQTNNRNELLQKIIENRSVENCVILVLGSKLDEVNENK